MDDAFEALARIGELDRGFDLVIIDPPVFARARAQVDRALLAYQRLTELSLMALSSCATLVGAFCSSRVDAETFFDTVDGAARRVERPPRELKRTGHPLDYPVTFDEGAYLECLSATAP